MKQNKLTATTKIELNKELYEIFKYSAQRIIDKQGTSVDFIKVHSVCELLFEEAKSK